MCLLWGTNRVFLSQKTAFFIVTAVKTLNLWWWCLKEAALLACFLQLVTHHSHYPLDASDATRATQLIKRRQNNITAVISFVSIGFPGAAWSGSMLANHQMIKSNRITLVSRCTVTAILIPLYLHGTGFESVVERRLSWPELPWILGPLQGNSGIMPWLDDVRFLPDLLMFMIH
jgi:hypothetical protein